MSITRSVYAGLLGMSVLLPSRATAQSESRARMLNSPAPVAAAMASDVLSSALSGCAANVLRGKGCIDGIVRGLPGGALIATGKWLNGEGQHWPAKLLVAAGNCASYNLLTEGPFRCGTDVGPIYLGIEGRSPYVAVIPDALLDFTAGMVSGELDKRASLRLGTPVFRTELNHTRNGMTLSNVVRMNEDYPTESSFHKETDCSFDGSRTMCEHTYDQSHVERTKRHESNHALQYAVAATRAQLLIPQLESRPGKLAMQYIYGNFSRIDDLGFPYRERLMELEAFSYAQRLPSAKPLVVRTLH